MAGGLFLLGVEKWLIRLKKIATNELACKPYSWLQFFVCSVNYLSKVKKKIGINSSEAIPTFCFTGTTRKKTIIEPAGLTPSSPQSR